MKTPHLVTLGFVLSGLCACISQSAIDCVGNAAGQAFGLAVGGGISNSLGPAVYRDLASQTQTDLARVTDAGTFVSVPHEGGRLEFAFEAGVRSGALPRRDEVCLMRDYALFRPADAGVSIVQMEVTFASEQPADGGTRVKLECTGLSRRSADGGAEPMADRSIDVIAP
jgi:hypothetical protein